MGNRNVKWFTKSGKPISIKDMSDSNIANTIRMLNYDTSDIWVRLLNEETSYRKNIYRKKKLTNIISKFKNK